MDTTATISVRWRELLDARDQLAAFGVHVPRRTPPPWGAWLMVPAPDLDERLAELDALLAAELSLSAARSARTNTQA